MAVFERFIKSIIDLAVLVLKMVYKTFGFEEEDEEWSDDDCDCDCEDCEEE